MKNEETIKQFIRFLRLQGIGKRRQEKYMQTLPKISEMLNKDFEEVTKNDLEELYENILKSKKLKSGWTKRDYLVITKKFFTWLYNKENEDLDEWEIPKIVKWIKAREPKRDKKLPSELITPKDVKLLEEHCRNLREKALILTLYESGARIGELQDLKIKDATFDDFGCILNLNGKTGYRQVRLIGSAPAISQWLQLEHPHKKNKDSYLFCNLMKGREGEKITYQAIAKILKKIKQRSGFSKDINPHLFRHSRATELSEYLTDAQRCNFFGWIQGSKVCRVYTHLQDTDRAILELNGLIEKGKDKDGKFKNIVCPRCNTSNPYGSKICSKCSMGLDIKNIEKYEDKQRLINKFLDPEELDKYLGEKMFKIYQQLEKQK